MYPDRTQYIIHDDKKHPISTTGQKIDPHDPTQWMTRDDATRAAAQLPGAGVGFVLTAEDPYFVIDLDACRDPVTGAYDARAQAWFAAFPGAGADVSRSGTGLHLWGCCDATLPESYMNRAETFGGRYEFYTSGRYIALGHGAIGNAAIDWTDQLRGILKPRPVASDLPNDGPVSEYTGPEDDAQLVQQAANARGSIARQFGDAPGFGDLWNGSADVLARFYPTDSDDAFDRSRADSALLTHLAFWTGKDVARMERLWLSSPLAQGRTDRRKLDRQDYRHNTVTRAAQTCKAVYSKPRVAAAVPGGLGVAVGVSSGAEVVSDYLTISDQERHFDGCVYITEDHAALVPDGRILPPDRFRIEYGGHEFQMQADGARPTRDAWDAFTQNRCRRFPIVAYKRFTPSAPFGAILDDDAVNTFRRPEWVAVEGAPQVAPFLNLMRKMLPDPGDREIVMTWMAALVQNPGVKFQWAIVLQGTEGNGKTFLLRCLEHAVGPHLSHFPNPEDLDEKFNTYIEGNLLIGVEEVYMPGRRDMLDRLKKYITNDRVEIRGMRVDKRMGDNLTNWMFLTNHRDAVIKGQNDRRYAVFYTAQQQATDLNRDGMGGAYFPDLWNWARAGGFDHVATYLHQYTCDARVNPAGTCHRAPTTTSTNEAIKFSLGRIEQEITEAIEEGLQGFRGGWVSSIRVRDYLAARQIRVSNNVLSEALANIGYTPFRGYAGGRAPALAQESMKRPKLYCIDAVQHVAQTVGDYEVAQGYVEPGSHETVVPLVPKSNARGG